MLLSAALVMNSCSWLGIGGDDGWLRDRQGSYLEAETVSPMDIPPELDSYTIDALYRIPAEPPGASEYFVQPPPPKPMDTRIRDGVVIQRFGDRAWLVVGATPSQVWPRLLDYWPTTGIALAREEPTQGLVETVWIEQQDSERRHKYLVRIEPGLHAGNSEIYVRHILDDGEGEVQDQYDWPQTSDSSEYEEAMLSSISLYLADRSDLYRASSVSLLAGSIEAESKANLDAGRGNEPTRLHLRIDYSRAWSQVGQALGSANVEIISSDRDDGRYTVLFSGEEEEDGPGFIGRLFGRDDPRDDAVEFHVDLQRPDTADSVTVTAETAAGEPAPRLQDLLIRTINDNLI